MKWIIDLESFTVEADTETDARIEAMNYLNSNPNPNFLIENITLFE